MNRRMAWVQNGVVTNFARVRPGQYSPVYGDQRLVDTENLDVRVGDTWDGKVFRREGVALTEEGEEAV